MQIGKRSIIGIACIVLLIVSLPAPSAMGAPGFEYIPVRDLEINQTAGEEQLCSFALNDLGQVAYITFNFATFPTIYSVYFWDGQNTQLVYQTDPNSSISLSCGSARGTPTVGLNNNGLISAFAFGVDEILREGIIFFRPGLGRVGLTTAQDFLGGNSATLLLNSRGNLNELGQVGIWVPVANALGTTSEAGTVVSSSRVIGGGLGSGPVVNNRGEVAWLVVRNFLGTQYLAIADFDPTRFPGSSGLADERIRVTALGPYSEWATTWGSPGLNDRGYASFSTQGPVFGAEERRFRIALVEPDRQSLVILADDADFPRNAQPLDGGSLNNLNQVLFGVRENPGPSVEDHSLWVVDPSGDPALAVYRQGESFPATGDGVPTFFSFIAEDNYSINDRSEVVFAVTYHTQPENKTHTAILLARPEPGLMPGNPVLPRPEDVLEFGWRFVNPCSINRRLQFFPPGSTLPVVPRCYTDPPVAAGYTYTAEPGSSNFASVLVPAPLAGGDSEFTVEFNGTSRTLSAGEVFDFSAAVPGGVSSFRIAGIDLGEGLSPANPAAFVTGLTWVGGLDAPHTFTMVPIVIDTDDLDGDGVLNGNDNCPSTANPDQSDQDRDGIGNACDSDGGGGGSDPVADAGADQTLEAVSAGGASVTLNGSGSQDPDGGILAFVWTGSFGTAGGISPVISLPLGTHLITLTVTDPSGATGSDIVQILVRDTTEPVLNVPPPITARATSAAGSVISYSATASDPVDPNPTINCVPQSGSIFPIGITTVNCSATDAAGNVSSATTSVTVNLGQPRLSGTIATKGVHSPGVVYVDLRLTNTGNGHARNIRFNPILLRTLSGSGTVAYNAALSPALPYTMDSLDVGASTTVRLYFDVPSTVKRFSLTENGAVQDVAGTNFNFSIGQAVIP